MAFALAAFAQTVITIGTDTQNHYIPVHPTFGYTYSQCIYLQSEINVPNQRIEKIWYYWNGYEYADLTDQWVIYMGHTSASYFQSSTAWLPRNSLTQVFSGQVITSTTAGWIEIVLDTPFFYNNTQNLVVAVEENEPGSDSSNGFFHSSSSSYRRSLRFSSDIINPDPADPPSGTMRYGYANIQLQLSAIPNDPQFNRSPADIDFGLGNVNMPSEWQNVTVSNIGGGTLSLAASAVSIIGTQASQFQFSTANLPAALSAGQSVNIPVRFVPSSEGAKTATLRIVYDGVNYDTALSGEGLPAGQVTIGDGNSNMNIPIYPYYGYTYSQSIYLQSEINMPNQRIEKIYYYWNGNENATSSDLWDIYMGHITADYFDMSPQWVPLSNLTQVFSGIVSLPAVEGWVEIVLANPFYYNNTDNLLIAVDENRPGYDSNSSYFHSTASQDRRSMRYSDDSINPDPANPPMSGIVQVFGYPNIKLLFGDAPTDPIFQYSPTDIDFGLVAQDEPTDWVNVTVNNYGGGILNLPSSALSIIGSHASQFQFNPINLPATLAAGQSVTIPVRFTATSEGLKTATLRMVYGSVNYDVALSGQGMSGNLVIIGNGTGIGSVPVYPYYTYTYSQSIYLASEIGMPGTIESLAWYWNGNSAITEPNIDIYMGHTSLSTMGSNFLPISGMTLVYSGPYSVGTTADWRNFILTTPFSYNGTDNLVIAVNENGGPANIWYSQLDGFHVSSVTGQRSRSVSNDNAAYNASTVTGGYNLTIVPNLMLSLSGGSVGQPDPPILTLQANGTLSWAAIDGAASYNIYSSSDPQGTFTYEASTNSTTWQAPDFPQARKFYRVTASTEPAAKILK